jgi:hypothetical protein
MRKKGRRNRKLLLLMGRKRRNVDSNIPIFIPLNLLNFLIQKDINF